MNGTDGGASKSPLHEALATPEELVAEIAKGRMVVLVDDEDR